MMTQNSNCITIIDGQRSGFVTLKKDQLSYFTLGLPSATLKYALSRSGTIILGHRSNLFVFFHHYRFSTTRDFVEKNEGIFCCTPKPCPRENINV